MMDLYLEEEESRDAGVATPYLEPPTPVAGPCVPKDAGTPTSPTPVARPCVPTGLGLPAFPTLVAGPCVRTGPGIPASSHSPPEVFDEDEDIWAKARGRGQAEKVGCRVSRPTNEQLMAKAVGKVAALAVSAALPLSVHCIGAKGRAAAVPAAAAAGNTGRGAPVPTAAAAGNTGCAAAVSAAAADIPHEGHGILASPTAVAASPRPAKKRAPRGTAGTFAGRRPPKNPAKLEFFKAAREAHLVNKMIAKKKAEEGTH